MEFNKGRVMKSSPITNAFMGLLALGGMGSVPASANSAPRSAVSAPQNDGCVELTRDNAYAQDRRVNGPVQALQGYDSAVVFSYNVRGDQGPRSGGFLDVMTPDMEAPIISVERDGTVRDYANGILCKAGSPEAKLYINYLKEGMNSYVQEMRDNVNYNRYYSNQFNRLFDYIASGIVRGRGGILRESLASAVSLGFEYSRQRATIRDVVAVGEVNRTAATANLFLQAAANSGEFGRRIEVEGRQEAERLGEEGDRMLENARNPMCAAAEREGRTQMPFYQKYCR